MSSNMISIEDFSMVELRVGKVIAVEELPSSRKLYMLEVNLGELGTKRIAAGVKGSYARDELVGKEIIVVANLTPKKVGKFVSEGMLLAAEDGERVALLLPDKVMPAGARIR